MYGRGGGGGGGRGSGGKRNILPKGPPHRPSSGGGNRHPVGGSSGARGRNPSTSAHRSGAQLAADETFSLVPGNPHSYAAIIRLAPSLVEEIKRVEAEGGTAKIKFDANPNHVSGNVIDVGGKEFRFSWSREMGHCDIYEEHQGGDNGNGILVESGCPWRKLNVQRVLDESTKNHVKMRSKEAERSSRQRKTIVLDPGNPSTKSQIKALAAVEASPWKNFTQKKDPPFKKRKIEPPQAAAPPKSVNKSGFPSTNNMRGRHSTSPLLSTPERSGCLASPSTTGNFGKAQASNDIQHIPVVTKENILDAGRLGAGKASGGGQDLASQKSSNSALSTDLETMLLSLLKEKPNGMSLKALEKAVGDAFPNIAYNIEPILKKIATSLAPGRYFLRPEVDMEGLKKFPASASSPEENHPKMSVPEDNQDTTSPPPGPFPLEMSPAEEMDEQATLTAIFGDDVDLDVDIDTPQHSQEHSGSGDKKVSDHSDGQVGSSTDSGSDSDSDSDSSESGSDSGSRSRSRSPGGSASRSSSDTESDSSSNSKQGSDEDVDIMTSDDEKEPKHEVQMPEAGLSTSTPPGRLSDTRPMQNGNAEKQDDDGSEDVDIEGLPDREQEADLATAVNLALNTDANSPENCILFSPNQDENPHHQMNNVSAGRENIVTDVVRLEDSDKLERSSGKLGNGSDVKQIDHSFEHVKSLKYESSAQSSKPGYQSQVLRHAQSPFQPSPDKPSEDHHKDLNFQMNQRGYSNHVPGKSAAQLQQSGRTASFSHDPEAADKFGKPAESSLQDRKHREKTTHSERSTLKQKDKFPREILGNDINLIEKSNKNSKDRVLVNRQSGNSDSKHDEQVRKFYMTEHFSESNMVSSPKDHHGSDPIRSPVVKRSGVLQRELSDLELGELRESSLEGPSGDKKQSQRKGSYKQSETKVGSSDSWNATLSKGKPASKPSANSGKLSSPNLGVGTHKGAEGSRKNSPDSNSDNPVKLSGTVRSHQQHSAIDHADVRSLSNKADDTTRPTGSVENQEIDLEGSGGTYKKSLVNCELEQVRAPYSGRGNKSKKSNPLTSSGNGRRRGTSLNEGHDGNLKKCESSSDENSSYSKYEKEEPELKGPITNYSKYKEYVQEYREKYGSYCSLNKILESYRNKFQDLGRELESAKSRDMENYYFLLGQLKESYQQCGPRHKRLKKIFVVLHKELTQLKAMIKAFAETYTR